MLVLCRRDILLFRCSRSLNRRLRRLFPVSQVISRCSRASAFALRFRLHVLTGGFLPTPVAPLSCRAKRLFRVARFRTLQTVTGKSCSLTLGPRNKLRARQSPDRQRLFLSSSCGELRKKWKADFFPLPSSDHRSRAKNLLQFRYE